jgi:hypothetical protein
MLLDDNGTSTSTNPLANLFHFFCLAPRVFQPGDGNADKGHDDEQGGDRN